MKKIFFFGGGNIAMAAIDGLIKSGFPKKDLLVIDRNAAKINKFNKVGIKKGEINKISRNDMVVLAVKPKDSKESIKIISKHICDPLVVSFVAGVKGKSLLKINKNLKIIRVMPNTGISQNRGVCGILNISAPKIKFRKVKALFSKLGVCIDLENESQIDEITSLIGSGPAFFLNLLKIYERRLQKITNDKKLVRKSISNLMGNISESFLSNKSINNMIDEIASKKGTTEAGLKSMNKNNLNRLFDIAIKDAIKRAKELSRDF